MDKRPYDMNTVTIYLDSNHSHTVDVPITPRTTCSQVLDYCTQAENTSSCYLVELWQDCERPLSKSERIYDILSQWGVQRDQVRFYLRHDPLDPPNNSHPERRNGILEQPTPPNKMPSRVDLTLSELQEMAARQQQQIEQQQQMLVAKEQRVKFLKQQEQRHLHIAGENDRLRKLRERVEAQEAKLRKLRQLRGEATGQANTNVTLASELDTIKSLFHEKEKELVTAVSKVDDLTKQLDELHKEKLTNGSSTPTQNAQALIELEKLRKELVMRNKLNEQQNTKLSAHREVLQQRKDEMTRLDKKIAELQSRIKKKPPSTLKNNTQTRGRVLSSNVAAVEPYMKHVPNNSEENLSNEKGQVITKQDPKYQTLPHNLKFKEDNLKKSRQNSIYGDVVKKDAGDDKGSSGTDTEVKPRPGSAQGVLSKTQPPSYNSVMGLAAKQGAQSSYSGKDMPVPPNTSADVPVIMNNVPSSTRISNLMTNFAPRPYGSTYSSSVLGARPTAVTVPDLSMLVTPNASVSLPKTSTPVSQADGKRVPGTITSQPQTSLLHNTQGLTKTTVSGSTGSVHPISSHVPQPSVTTIPVQNMAGSSHNSTGESNHGNQSGSNPNTSSALKTPMYASKSVIANTYMRKLGPSALEKYRNSMSQIYQGFTPGQIGGDSLKTEQSEGGQSGLTATVAPLNVHVDHVSDSRNSSRFDPSQEKTDVDRPQYDKEPPPYNIDPVKFRPNAPRPHRRRLSSGGDSPHAEDKLHARIPTPVSLPSDDVFITKDDLDGSKLPTKPPDLIQNDPSIRKSSNSTEPSSPSSRQSKERPNRLPFALRRKGNLKSKDSSRTSRRVSFDPLALLLDASLEGELDLVKRTAQEVPDPSCPNDEGITALHNAICAGHFEIVKFLVEFGCNVNAPDSDGWTPLHCAASCNNLPMVKVLVEHGACIFATTISDQETAAEKCEEDEDGYDGCSEYLYNIQEKLGILNSGIVYAVFDYSAQNNDELNFKTQDKITILRKGDETEQEWWWAKKANKEGYIPRNLLGLYPRVNPQWLKEN